MTSLAQCNEEGETPLLVAIKQKNVSLVHEFLAIFKKFDREFETMPPMCFFTIDQLSNQIPITELIDYLIKDINNSDHWLPFLAQVFIKSTSFTREDRIIALELIGASLMMNLTIFRYVGLCRIGLQCWREAMILRSNPYALPKIPATSVLSDASSVVFESANEVMEIEELNLLQEELNRNYRPLDQFGLLHPYNKRMQLQALLVIRRISTQATHPNWLYLESLLRFGTDVLAYRIWGEYLEPQNVALNVENRILINTCYLILEKLNGFDPQMISLKTRRVFIETLNLMSCYFVTVKLMEDELDETRTEELSYANFLASTEFINAVANLFPEQEKISSVKFGSHFFASIIYNFLFVLDSISPQLTYQEKKIIEEHYSSYIRNFFPTRTTTVLHVAVQEIKKSDYKLRVNGSEVEFEIQGKLNTIHSLIKLILKLGTDPNAIDEMGRTPLHILAGMKKHHLNKYLPFFQTLVNAGSYLDVAKNNDETVRSVLKKTMMRYTQKGEMVDPYFESLIDSVLPLTCLCTRVIRRHRIPYQDRLPLILQKLVAPP